MGCHALLQGIFQTQGSNPCLVRLLHWQAGSLPLAPPGKPAYKEVVVGQLLSRVRLFATPWTVAHPASPSMGFSRQEYWRRLPFPPPGDLPDPGIKPTYSASPPLTGRFFTTRATRETLSRLYPKFIIKSYRYFKNQMRCGGLPWWSSG